MRALALDCGLTEELKWGCPCYTYDGANIILIHIFKEYCAFLFFKGVLLKNEAGLLIQQTENVQVARQMRFVRPDQIVNAIKTIKAYILEAIEIEKSGLKPPLKKTPEFDMPVEFASCLAKDDVLKTAFDALTPGRQRAYLLYFSAPKRSKTREPRIEKCISAILEGRGLKD